MMYRFTPVCWLKDNIHVIVPESIVRECEIADPFSFISVFDV